MAVLAIWLPQDFRSWGLAANTAILAVATCAIAVPLGTLLAALLVKTDCAGPSAGNAGPGVATVHSAVFASRRVAGRLWRARLAVARGAGLGMAEWLRGAVWVHAAAATPWVAGIVALGARGCPASLEEAALLDASPLTVLVRVTLRQAAPAMAAATLWVGVTVAGEIAVTDLFQIRTYAEELYTQTALEAATGDAQIRILPGIALVAWMALAGSACVERLAPGGREIESRRPLVFSLGAWRGLAAVLLLLLMALLVVLPLVNLAWKCGVIVLQTAVGRERHWSLVKCATVVASSPWRYGREVRASFEIGVTVATAAVAIGTLLGWLARGSRAWRGALMGMIVAGLALPGPVVGLGLVWMFNRPGWTWAHWLYDRTIVPPVVAQLVRGLPLVCLILWYAFDSLSTQELEDAELDGAGPWARLTRVALPQRRGACGGVAGGVC